MNNRNSESRRRKTVNYAWKKRLELLLLCMEEAIIIMHIMRWKELSGFCCMGFSRTIYWYNCNYIKARSIRQIMQSSHHKTDSARQIQQSAACLCLKFPDLFIKKTQNMEILARFTYEYMTHTCIHFLKKTFICFI